MPSTKSDRELTAWAGAVRPGGHGAGRGAVGRRARCSVPAPIWAGCRRWSATPARRICGTRGALARMFDALDQLPIPLVGRVHGAALGGGVGLAAVCDVWSSATEDAAFGFTEVKLGILPAVISPYALAKIGRSAARELFLTGRAIQRRRARANRPDPCRRRGPSDLDRVVAKVVNDLLTSGTGGARRRQAAHRRPRRPPVRRRRDRT